MRVPKLSRNKGGLVTLTGFLLWLLAFLLLVRTPGSNPQLALISGAIFGLVLPLLAVALTRGVERPTAGRRAGVGALWALAYLGTFSLLVLGWGIGLMRGAFTDERSRDLAVLALKLTTMVLFPLLIVAGTEGRLALSSLLQTPANSKAGRVFLVFGPLVLAILTFATGSVQQVAKVHVSAETFAWALPACFLWVVVSAGLCEEVLFRAFVQSPLAAFFGSNAVAIALGTLAFALAHVPGLYLRPADNPIFGAQTPTLAGVTVYAIAVLAPPGVFWRALGAHEKLVALDFLTRPNRFAFKLTRFY